MTSPMLSVQSLETTFFTKAGAVKAVDGVTYSVGRGETLGVVGESGCGKSVMAFSILGLLSQPGKVTGGQVLLDGKDLTKVAPSEMRHVRGKKIAMIFQEPMTALNPVLTVGYQIIEQLVAHETLTPQQARTRAIELLALVGIPSPGTRIDDYPHQLSGGMRQRAMIAMALSCNPSLLIADEPTTALDVTIQAQILDLLQRLQDEFKMSMQFITHDLGVISEIADRVIVMYAGKLVEEAPASDLFSRPRHPYTVGLLESIPRIEMSEGKSGRLKTISGTVPSLLALPPGCRFQNRCPRATEVCRSVEPPLVPVDGGRRLACYNPYG
jgi:peptide/nickel transport system ATP-binding protein